MADPQPSDLPEGWKEIWHPDSGRYYYVSPAGESTWDDPRYGGEGPEGERGLLGGVAMAAAVAIGAKMASKVLSGSGKHKVKPPTSNTALPGSYGASPGSTPSGGGSYYSTSQDDHARYQQQPYQHHGPTPPLPTPGTQAYTYPQPPPPPGAPPGHSQSHPQHDQRQFQYCPPSQVQPPPLFPTGSTAPPNPRPPNHTPPPPQNYHNQSMTVGQSPFSIHPSDAGPGMRSMPGITRMPSSEDYGGSSYGMPSVAGSPSIQSVSSPAIRSHPPPPHQSPQASPANHPPLYPAPPPSGYPGHP